MMNIIMNIIMKRRGAQLILMKLLFLMTNLITIKSTKTNTNISTDIKIR